MRAALEPLRDDAAAKAMAAYMKNNFEFLGIKTTPRRKAVAPILARRSLDWPLVWDCWHADAREYQYVAGDHLRRIKVFPPAQLDSLRELISTKSWWDSVDSLAKVAGSALGDAAPPTDRAHPASQVIRAWANDRNMWVRRAAIISQLGKREATDLQLLADAIEENLPGTRFGNEFFISKAIGWALRDLYRTNPSWVLSFLDLHGVANLTRREALKHHR